MEKKRICLIIPSLQAGGMQKVMSELADYFCQNNELDVHIILYGRTPDVFYHVPDNLLIHRPKNSFNDKFRLISTLVRLFYVRQTVKANKPDTILSFGEYWNSFVLLALYGLNYPVYISDRCSPEKKFGRLHSFLRKWLYPRAKGIIAQTDKAKELYLSQFRHNNIEVIGNPIRQISVEGLQYPKENIVLTVGRLIVSKHHDKLIKVFAQILSPDWKLIIIGDDALKQKNMDRLKQLIHDVDCDGRIILAGTQLNTDSYYKRSKIFAFMSSSEGFPNVIGEAMSAGLPVVAYDCIAGPTEMLSDGEDGYLIPLNDEVLFKAKLETLMNNESLRSKLGNQAIKNIRKFSKDKIGISYYNMILAK